MSLTEDERDPRDAQPVAVAVGEAPGDVPVGSRHQERCARQRNASLINRGLRGVAGCRSRA